MAQGDAEDVMMEVIRLIRQHRAATPGSVHQAIIGSKLVKLLKALGYRI